MKDYVCGIDIGSSTLKLMFVAEDGSVLGPFKREIETYFPQPFYVEQEPGQWYKLLKETLAEVFQMGMVDKYHIKAILPSAPTHTVVLLDQDFKPVRRAILWNDQRSASLAADFKDAQRVFALTNHMPSAMWSLFQNLWVKKNEPEIWKKVHYMMFPKDYLRFLMTGEYCTDYIDAEGSQFYDAQRKEWSPWLCSFLDFPVSQLPPLRHAMDLAGRVAPKAAQELNLLEGTPVYVGTTDTALEIVVAGALYKGQATIKLATSGRICVITDQAYPHPLLVNYSHVSAGLYYAGTGTRSCTTSLRWFKDQFVAEEMLRTKEEGKSVYALLDEEAAQIQPGSEKLFFHPYLLGEFTPYANDKLCASFIGATMKHTRAHFIRAILEGTAYSLRDSMNTLNQLGIPITAEHLLLIGGGSTSSLWSQILADVLNRSLAVPRYSDSSLGGAMLAGVSCGMFKDLEEAFFVCNEIKRIVRPIPQNVEIYDKLFSVYTKLVSTLLPVYEDLSQIKL
jgi:xylulokinase